MEIDDDVTDLKLRYFEQQTILANHEHKYLDVCKHYREVLETESVENNPEQLRAVSFDLLAPYLIMSFWLLTKSQGTCADRLLYCLVSV